VNWDLIEGWAGVAGSLFQVQQQQLQFNYFDNATATI
jgi:uncharacterized protein YukE